MGLGPIGQWFLTLVAITISHVTKKEEANPSQT